MGVASAPAKQEGYPFARRDDDGGALLVGVGGGERGPSGGVVEEVEQSPSPPPMSSCGRYILHRVCRFDTLAGVAIKYGVEVMNDPPLSPRLLDPSCSIAMSASRRELADGWMISRRRLLVRFVSGGGREAGERAHRRPADVRAQDAADPAPRKAPTRRIPFPSLFFPKHQGYYGLAQTPKRDPTNEATEMATAIKGQHRKARSISTGFPLVNGDANWETDDAEKPIWRRQKADLELSTREDNSGGLLARTGQGLALRPKSGNRPDINNSQQDLVATGLVPSYGDGLLAVKKSSSTPEFQDSDNNIASVWLRSKWSLKPDAFTLPLPILLFDSIPKPIAAWRNKAARD